MINIDLDVLNKDIFVSTYEYERNVTLVQVASKDVIELLNFFLFKNEIIKYQSYYIDDSIKKLTPIYVFEPTYFFIDANFKNSSITSKKNIKTINQIICTYISAKNKSCSFLLRMYSDTFELFILNDSTIYFIIDNKLDIINLLYFLPIKEYSIQLIESFITLHRLEQ